MTRIVPLDPMPLSNRYQRAALLVEPRRAPSLGIIVTAWLLTGCTASSAPAKAYIPAEPTIVGSDPDIGEWSALARPHDATRSGRAVVRGRVGVAPSAVVALVGRFFAAIGQEDLASLRRLFAADAVATDARGQQQPLESEWVARFRRFDYRQVQGVRLYWQPFIAIFDYPDEREAKLESPLNANAEGIVVRVPMERTRFDGRELFGQCVWLALRQTADGLKITGFTEDL